MQSRIVAAIALSLSASVGSLCEAQTHSVQDARLMLLDDFAQAWNRHDVDALMSMMTGDPVFEASGGSDVVGERYEGADAVRASFAAVFERFPDAQWNDARHHVFGDRGLSEWTFTGTQRDGQRVEVNGCDLFVTGER